MSEQEYWEKKLEESGLGNIEYKNGMLKKDASFNEDSRNYFIHLGKFTHEYAFNDDFDELVWRLKAEGSFNNEIARLIKVDKGTVSRALKRHKKQFEKYVLKEVSEKWDDF